MGKVKILSRLFLVKVMDRCPCCPLPSGCPYHLWVARQALPAPSGASCHLQVAESSGTVTAWHSSELQVPCWLTAGPLLPWGWSGKCHGSLWKWQNLILNGGHWKDVLKAKSYKSWPPPPSPQLQWEAIWFSLLCTFLSLWHKSRQFPSSLETSTLPSLLVI